MRSGEGGMEIAGETRRVGSGDQFPSGENLRRCFLVQMEL